MSSLWKEWGIDLIKDKLHRNTTKKVCEGLLTSYVRVPGISYLEVVFCYRKNAEAIKIKSYCTVKIQLAK